MGYREIAPPEDLAPYVQCFWTYAGPGDGAIERVTPDGRCELIVHLGQPYAEAGADGRFHIQPRALFAGQLTRPLSLRATGPVSVACVRFKPAGARATVGAPLSHFTDRRVDLVKLWGPSETDRLVASTSPEAAIDTLTVRLRARLAGARALDPIVLQALALMQGAETGPSPGAIAARLGLSLRQLERRFADAVGISPRAYASVLRFRRAFDEIERAPDGGWIQAALASGYFDQPQLARDFRRFLGTSATAFARERIGLAAALSAARG